MYVQKDEILKRNALRSLYNISTEFI